MAQEIQEIPKERYYDNQLLGVQDFEREQAYHIAQRELQTRLFYTPGVLAGLAVRNGSAAGQIQVLAGVAIDGRGRLIILAGHAKFDGANITAQAAKFILDLNQHPSSYTDRKRNGCWPSKQTRHQSPAIINGSSAHYLR